MTAAAASRGAGRASLAGWTGSVALHGALAAALLLIHPAPRRSAEPVVVEIVETAPPPPPTPAPEPVPPPAVAPAPAPRPRVATSAPRTPAPAPRAAPAGPPPPSEEAKAPTPPGPVRFGVSMSSTTAAGGYAAPVGNSVQGAPPRQAPDPGQVSPYRAERYAAASEVSSLPQPVRVEVPRSEYPPDALRQGIEGVVRLRLLIDEQGDVREATIVSDPGHGLGAAAVRAARRWFKFRPARKDGVAVATDIPFTVQFELQ